MVYNECVWVRARVRSSIWPRVSFLHWTLHSSIVNSPLIYASKNISSRFNYNNIYDGLPGPGLELKPTSALRRRRGCTAIFFCCRPADDPLAGGRQRRPFSRHWRHAMRPAQQMNDLWRSLVLFRIMLNLFMMTGRRPDRGTAQTNFLIEPSTIQ